MPYIIDGHNLIAALPGLALDDPDDEAKLVLQLRAWSARVRKKAIVIFDGGLPGGYSAALSTSPVQVIFAAQRRTDADTLIKARLLRLPDAGNWTVVSSDHAVRDKAQQVGARVLTSQEFVAELSETLPAMVEPPEKPERVTAAEVDAWLEEFPEPPSAAPQPRQQPSKRQATPKPAHGAAPAATVPASPGSRSGRTIGEQMGVAIKPEPVTEKPDELTPDELAAWLEEFPEPPPRPASPKPAPAAKPKRERKPTFAMNKHRPETLSAEEVDDWLALFPEVETPAPQAEPAAKKPRKPVDDEAALWQRLYGEEPTVKPGKRR